MSKVKIPVITIDSGVPIPADLTQYPVGALEVGDSFLFPLSKRNSVQSRVSRVKKATSRDFTVKKVDNLNGRVWRTK